MENTGVELLVGQAERQAAVNSLVQQGRTSQIRGLEGFDENGLLAAGATPRLPGGRPATEMHRLLDHAYEEYGSKLGDKAPDLMPNRRTTNGVAAFTDLKPEDVTAWHHSTVTSARNFFNTPRLDQNGVDQAPANREQMLRAYSQATQSPATRAKLSLDQVTRVRQVLNDAQAAGFADANVINNINDMYTTLGGV
jgi:hypothetical protein